MAIGRGPLSYLELDELPTGKSQYYCQDGAHNTVGDVLAEPAAEEHSG